HDAREPAQYVFTCGSLRLGVLTDLGSITAHVQQAFNACDALLLEANHDLDMLWNGPYPPSLKERVASDWGHLNNRQTAELLELLHSSRLKKVVIGHISRKNNTVDVVRQTLGATCRLTNLDELVYACQDEGFDWIFLGNN
ncbi:MAG TPA: MBL fold metallo-hydrolase, partial [Cyclobacteriaceae bacterium]|nr:MBL fold metallo-hydrolase [Cyclobacteriaceae bacterium]